MALFPPVSPWFLRTESEKFSLKMLTSDTEPSVLVWLNLLNLLFNVAKTILVYLDRSHHSPIFVRVAIKNSQIPENE